MSWDLERWNEYLGGTIAGANAQAEVRDFTFDNRHVEAGSLFIAVRGANVDGHDFALEAARAGAVACLVDRPVEAPHILVSDVVGAIAKLGTRARNEFDGPVVGITGSNGKTSCKEFTASAFRPLGPVLKNLGNQNTELTSPLTWTRREPGTRAAIIEMAMRGPNQIDHLARIARPHVGIITMIGTAHIEMVGNREGIAAAKGEILDHIEPGGTAVLYREDDFYGVLSARARTKVMTFGHGPDADCRVVGARAQSWSESEVRLALQGKAMTIKLQTVGRHQALNAAAALLAASVCGVEPEAAAEAMRDAELPPMRMEIFEKDGVTMVLDNYNASPDSMIAALRTLSEVGGQGRRIAILGEMKELGKFYELGHQHVGRAILPDGVDELVVYGAGGEIIAREAQQHGYPSSQVVHATDLEELTRIVKGLSPGDTVLIKGSRALQLERVKEAWLA